MLLDDGNELLEVKPDGEEFEPLADDEFRDYFTTLINTKVPDKKEDRIDLANKLVSSLNMSQTLFTKASIGMACALYIIKEHGLYRELGHDTFTDFARSGDANTSYQTVCRLLQIVDNILIKAGVPVEKIANISQSNLIAIAPMINENNSEGLLNLAKTLRHADLTTHIQQLKQNREIEELQNEDPTSTPESPAEVTTFISMVHHTIETNPGCVSNSLIITVTGQSSERTKILDRKAFEAHKIVNSQGQECRVCLVPLGKKILVVDDED